MKSEDEKKIKMKPEKREASPIPLVIEKEDFKSSSSVSDTTRLFENPTSIQSRISSSPFQQEFKRKKIPTHSLHHVENEQSNEVTPPLTQFPKDFAKIQQREIPRESSPTKETDTDSATKPFDFQLVETPQDNAPTETLNSLDRDVPFDFQLVETPKDNSTVKPDVPSKKHIPFDFQLVETPKDKAPVNSPDRHVPFNFKLAETPKDKAPVKPINSPDRHVPFDFKLAETPKDKALVKPTNSPDRHVPFDFQLMETTKDEVTLTKPDTSPKPHSAFNIQLKKTPNSTIFDKPFEPAVPFQGFARMSETPKEETPSLKPVPAPEKPVAPSVPFKDFGRIPETPKEVVPSRSVKAAERNNPFNINLKETQNGPSVPFQDFEFKPTVKPILTEKPVDPGIHDFQFKRTVFDSPKKSQPHEEEIKKEESNLLPSQVNSSKGSFKQPQRSRSQSDQIREFVKGMDISSQESPSPIHLRTKKKTNEPQNEYKPINVSQLRAPFQSDTNNNPEPLIIDNQKHPTQPKSKPPGYHHHKAPAPVVTKRPVNTYDIKKAINVQPPPLSLERVEHKSQIVFSPSGKPIKSILSRESKKNSNKKVQFNNLVDVGEAAIPAYVETPPPTQNTTPPKIPPKDPVNVVNGNAPKQNKDINNIVDQMNRSSDQLPVNAPMSLINGGPYLITPSSSPRDGAPNRRDALVQAKQRFHTTSTELTNKLTLNKNDDLSYGVNSTRPKGLSWFTDRSDENENINGNKPNGFKSIPAY